MGSLPEGFGSGVGELVALRGEVEHFAKVRPKRRMEGRRTRRLRGRGDEAERGGGGTDRVEAEGDKS